MAAPGHVNARTRAEGSPGQGKREERQVWPCISAWLAVESLGSRESVLGLAPCIEWLRTGAERSRRRGSSNCNRGDEGFDLSLRAPPALRRPAESCGSTRFAAGPGACCGYRGPDRPQAAGAPQRPGCRSERGACSADAILLRRSRHRVQSLPSLHSGGCARCPTGLFDEDGIRQRQSRRRQMLPTCSPRSTASS